MNDINADTKTTEHHNPAHKKAGRLLRVRDASGNSDVNHMELFFDLVYVFSVSQLSHYLLHHPTVMGVLQGTILFLAVWWAWMYTTWTTNWVDPGRTQVRLMLAVIMLLSLVLSAAIPKAFAEYGLYFALSYCTIQVGRTLWAARAVGEWEPGAKSKNLTRASIWFMVSAIFWIGGAFLEDPVQRMIAWAIALVIEYSGPAAYFAVPGLGKSTTNDWNVSGAHMAERCALLVIIALGEGIILTGSTFSEAERIPGAVWAFGTAFVGSVAMWWIYFDTGAKRAEHHIAHHEDTGSVARSAYTYAHIPIVAGIILAAVVDEQVLAHPYGHVEPFFLWALVGSAFLFLGGVMIFKRMTSGRNIWPLSHLVGLGLYALIGLWGLFGHPQPLWLAIAAALVFVIVAVWEWVSFNGGWIERIEQHGGERGRAWKQWSYKRLEETEQKRRKN